MHGRVRSAQVNPAALSLRLTAVRCSRLPTVFLTALLVSCSSGDAAEEAPDGSTSSPVRAASSAGGDGHDHSKRKDRPLPAFSGFTLGGEQLSVSSLIGRRFLLFFFNPKVKAAKNATAAVNAVAALGAEYNFSVVGVAVASSQDESRRFVADYGIAYRVINDSNAKISQRLGLRSPVALLGVDSEGYLKFGFASLPDDAEAIEMQLRTGLRLPAKRDAPLALASRRPMAPDFLADILDDDVPFSLSAHRGRAVVMMFFLHTCPHCHDALAFMKKALSEIPEDKRPVFAGIEVSGRSGAVRTELREAELDFFPVLFDHDGKIRKLFGVHGGVPDTFLIDPKGRIARRVVGWRKNTDPPLMRMRIAKLSRATVPMLLRPSGYSGNEVCGVCHESQLVTWQFTKHAGAFGTLVKHGEDGNAECIGCHVVGWEQPGGFTRSQPDSALENVGCESCHGRGGPHLSAGFVTEANYAPVCASCHDAEHSLRFDYATFHPRISHSANFHLTMLSADARRAKLAALGRPGGDVLSSAAETVGSEACAACHSSEYATWSASPHARAHATLEAKGATGDAECLRCHTTAMGKPGGFPESGNFAQLASGNPDLARVGCESCHGPGGDHIAPEATKIGTILSLGDKCDSCAIQLICGGCHDEANDPGFVFEVQDKIERQRHGTIEPGTGKALGTSASLPVDTSPASDHELAARVFSALDERS